MRPHQRTVAQPGQITPFLCFVAVPPQRYHAGEQMGAQREHQTAVAATVPGLTNARLVVKKAFSAPSAKYRTSRPRG